MANGCRIVLLAADPSIEVCFNALWPRGQQAVVLDAVVDVGSDPTSPRVHEMKYALIALTSLPKFGHRLRPSADLRRGEAPVRSSDAADPRWTRAPAAGTPATSAEPIEKAPRRVGPPAANKAVRFSRHGSSSPSRSTTNPRQASSAGGRLEPPGRTPRRAGVVLRLSPQTVAFRGTSLLSGTFWFGDRPDHDRTLDPQEKMGPIRRSQTRQQSRRPRRRAIVFGSALPGRRGSQGWFSRFIARGKSDGHIVRAGPSGSQAFCSRGQIGIRGRYRKWKAAHQTANTGHGTGWVHPARAG